MKYLIAILALSIFTTCQPKVESNPNVSTLDIPAELEKIEQMRSSFQKTIKERRYGDLGTFVTPDVISVGPGSEDWITYRKLREQHGNKFRYDSIIMRPKETVIVSDSIAYDFGVSSMYYTNEDGVVNELEDTFLVILKRTKDGEWKLHRELASSLVVW